MRGDPTAAWPGHHESLVEQKLYPTLPNEKKMRLNPVAVLAGFLVILTSIDLKEGVRDLLSYSLGTKILASG